jgi:hypothetical protein
MLDKDSRLQPNVEEVAAKVMDGEAILIKLSDGTYYSMDGVGGFVWETLEANHSLAEVTAAVAARYDVTREQAWADLERLAQELVRENLVKVSNHTGRPPGQLGQPSQTGLSYSTPVLNTYRDMADLLALDPPAVGFEEIAWKDPDAPTP